MGKILRKVAAFILVLMVTQGSWILAQEKDEILAKVGNEVITRLDFETRLKSLPPAAREELKNIEKRKQLLDNMVKARLLVLEAGTRGLTGKPDIQAGLRMQRDDFLTQEYVRAYLEKKAEVSDEEAENIYNTNPEIKEREHLRVSQIVVEKEEEAKEVLARLKKGENFKKLVKERSIDLASKQTDGELEWFERGKGKNEFEEALLKVEKGGISDIVKVNGRYYILKLEDRRIIPKPPFLKIKDRIVEDLKYKKMSEVAEKETEELKKKINVETFYGKLSAEEK